MPFARHAYAKINWGLLVGRRMENGYHSLDMLMQSISLCDDLSCEPAPSDISISAQGIQVPSDSSNLIWKAAERMREVCRTDKGVTFHLVKRIPTGAGLGGGSADCAAALKLLREMWKPDLPDEVLYDIGAELGADVPYCLYEKPARVKGFGEMIEPSDLPSGLHIVVLKRCEGIPTGKIFQLYDKNIYNKYVKTLDIAEKSLSNCNWDEFGRNVCNDLFEPACFLMPGIRADIQALDDLGSLFTAMSGSGSAVFGVFGDEETCRKAAAETGGIAAVTL